MCVKPFNISVAELTSDDLILQVEKNFWQIRMFY